MNAHPAPFPRLAEDADAMFCKLLELATGVVDHRHGLLVPTVQVMGGGEFVVRDDGRIDRLLLDGIARAPANEWWLSQFCAALKEDQLRVVILTRPGSGWRRVLQVLHEPHGLAFHPNQPHDFAPAQMM